MKHGFITALFAALAMDALNVWAGASPDRVPAPGNMVKIQGGSFTMGSPSSEAWRFENEIQHTVTVSSFYMGKYEVTQKEWVETMGSNPSSFKGDNLPVENVSWYEVIEYCNKRSISEGLTPAYTVNGYEVVWKRSTNGYRLPTEAEWEYACRAGTVTPYSSGNTADSAGWYKNNSEVGAHPVGQKAANNWGLYDMHGNVYEWCWDKYGKYETSAQDNPTGSVSGINRVLRGGSWYNFEPYLRSANRIASRSPSFLNSFAGFRVARNS